MYPSAIDTLAFPNILAQWTFPLFSFLCIDFKSKSLWNLGPAKTALYPFKCCLHSLYLRLSVVDFMRTFVCGCSKVGSYETSVPFVFEAITRGQADGAGRLSTFSLSTAPASHSLTVTAPSTDISTRTIT